MLNIVKVQCPHCGVEGQIMLPAADTLIVGPCPSCNKSVAIFAGSVLPLDTEVMSRATRDEAYNHILECLIRFVRERLDHAFGNAEAHGIPVSAAEESRAADKSLHRTSPKTAHISETEIMRFLSDELPKIDNMRYFKAIFG